MNYFEIPKLWELGALRRTGGEKSIKSQLNQLALSKSNENIING